MTGLIAVATDFGPQAIYSGQMHALLLARNPDIPVVDLINDLPAFEPKLAAYLLASFIPYMPKETLYLCVVDPGVGSDRSGLVLQADGQWLVGPDNGILAVSGRHAEQSRWWRITWRPGAMTDSFHGRDLFAPVAAMLAKDGGVPGEPISPDLVVGADWPADLPCVVYVDHFGNLITGIRADEFAAGQVLQARGQDIPFARTFSDVPRGSAFWHANGNGLVEIAINQGRADQALGLKLGDGMAWAAS